MEQYVVAIIPVVALYVGWMTTRMMKLAETQSVTVTKLDMIVVRQDSQHDRQDSLESRVDSLMLRG